LVRRYENGGAAREMDENEDKMTARETVREKVKEREGEDSFYHTDS